MGKVRCPQKREKNASENEKLFGIARGRPYAKSEGEQRGREEWGVGENAPLRLTHPPRNLTQTTTTKRNSTGSCNEQQTGK